MVKLVVGRSCWAFVLLGSLSSVLGADGGLAPTYFGFWGPDAPSEMRDFTNLAFANTPEETVSNAAYGIHSLLKLHDIFVNQSVRWHHHLNDDYAARWASAAPALAPLVANGSCLGFFLGDELLWNGMNFTEMVAYADAVRAAFPRGGGGDGGGSGGGDGHAIIYTNAAWPTLFPAMPGEPTSAGDVAAVPEEQLWLRVPAALDWWGVDVYPDQYSQEGALGVLHANVLRKFTSPAQRLVVIPPFYGDRANSTTADRRQLDCGADDCDDAMLRWGAQFNRTFLNASYPDAARVVAAMPYHWQSLGDGGGMRAQGGVELQRARAAWEATGRAIVAAERRHRN